jgi:hypothetical protein
LGFMIQFHVFFRLPSFPCLFLAVARMMNRLLVFLLVLSKNIALCSSCWPLPYSAGDQLQIIVWSQTGKKFSGNSQCYFEKRTVYPFLRLGTIRIWAEFYFIFKSSSIVYSYVTASMESNLLAHQYSNFTIMLCC